jgi:AcrR family transcriptional regulator
MARAKSDDKKNAILEAATRVFAERGLSAATAAISTEAGVAEGTLFTYFKTKDDLVNALYREIKSELASAMMEEFPRKRGVRARLLHLWDRYVTWGIANGEKQSVLRRIELWDGLSKESKKVGAGPFAEVKAIVEEGEEQGTLRDLPRRFVVATMGALLEAAIELARDDPKRADVYRVAGFEMFWMGIAGK